MSNRWQQISDTWLPGILFTAYSVLLLAPNLYLFQGPDGLFVPDRDLAFGLQTTVPTVFCYILLCALVRRLDIMAWLVLPFVLLAPGELFYCHQYHTSVKANILSIVTDTDPVEAGAYMIGLVWPTVVIITSNLLLSISLCIYLTRKRARWVGNFKIIMALVSAIIVAGTLVDFNRLTQVLHGGPHEKIIATELVAIGYPARVPGVFDDYFKERAELASMQARLKDFHFHAVQHTALNEKEVYILVLGETGRRNHWQLDGYTRPTTPLLMKEGNLVNFPDLISPSSATSTAVPMLITRKPIEQANQFNFNEKTVISAFKEAGFQTYWLTNQPPKESAAGYYTEADHVGFYNYSQYWRKNSFDGVLLKPLERVLALPDKKQLIILHTLGSHFDYASRYPDAFNVFQPSISPPGSVGMLEYSKRVEMNNSYDNSVLYTDYFLDGVISRLRASGYAGFLMYSADHGEDLYENGCLTLGHGYNHRFNVEIPALAWYSDRYASLFPQKVAALKVNANKHLITSDYFSTLTDAASITVDKNDVTRSIVSPQFTYHPRVININRMIDYDKATFVGGCGSIVDPKASVNGVPEPATTQGDAGSD